WRMARNDLVMTALLGRRIPRATCGTPLPAGRYATRLRPGYYPELAARSPKRSHTAPRARTVSPRRRRLRSARPPPGNWHAGATRGGPSQEEYRAGASTSTSAPPHSPFAPPVARARPRSRRRLPVEQGRCRSHGLAPLQDDQRSLLAHRKRPLDAGRVAL